MANQILLLGCVKLYICCLEILFKKYNPFLSLKRHNYFSLKLVENIKLRLFTYHFYRKPISLKMASQGHLPTPPPPPPPLPPPSPRIPLRTNPPDPLLKPELLHDDTPTPSPIIREKEKKSGFVKKMTKLFSRSKSKRRHGKH